MRACPYRIDERIVQNNCILDFMEWLCTRNELLIMDITDYRNQRGGFIPSAGSTNFSSFDNFVRILFAGNMPLHYFCFRVWYFGADCKQN